MIWKRFGFGFLFVLFTSIALGQQIQVQNFSTSAYGVGGSISVPVKVSGCFQLDNRFNMYLSDENGSFANSTLIGSYNGFFTPFVNGNLPSGAAPGTNYKIRITSTNPVVSVETSTFSISATSVPPVVNPIASSSNTINDSTFGRCLIFANQNLVTQFTVPAAHVLSAEVTDSLGNPLSATVTATQVQFTMIPGNYYTLKASFRNTGDNSMSTKSFLVYVSHNNLSLQTSGASDACLPDTKTYTVNVVGSGGIGTNYPGTKYMINWGDGTTDVYTHCQMIAMNGEMKHDYVNTSCGMPPIVDLNPVQYNAFRVNVQAENVFCPTSFTSITTYAKVWQKPVAEFEGPEFWCINVPVTFINHSEAGLSGYGNVVNCIDVAQYEWYVDGEMIFGAGVNLTHTFTTPGIHTIRLVALNDPCSDEITHTICIEEPLTPEFKINNLDSITGCAPLTINVQNNTVVGPNPCRPLPWLWSVLFRGSMTAAQAGVHYTIAPHDSAKSPSFTFLVPGEYYIRLTIPNSCGDYIKDVPVTITDVASVTFSQSVTRYCGIQTIDFSQAPNRPSYNSGGGTETYNWTVTGGSHSFVGGTNATSAYPQIQFDAIGTYTVRVQFNNDCGTQSATKQIIFDAPVTAAASNDTTVCFSENSIQLSGTAGGASVGANWSIVNGSGSFDNASNANAVYTFSAADKTAGTVTIRYNVNGVAGSACGNAQDDLVISILPQVIITTSADTAICSGGNVNYSPASNMAGATFSWTSSVVSGSVTGNTTAGNGAINNILTNQSATTPAVVKYFITPSAPGCNGNAFEFTVVVQPSPTLAITKGDDTLCTGSTTDIRFQSSYSNSLFSWTSSVISGTATGFTSQSSPGTISAINDVLVNVGSAPARVQYILQLHTDSVICGGEKDTVVIVVHPNVTTANAGVDQQLCNVTSATLSANTPTVGIGTWSQLSGPAATIANANQPGTTVSGLQAGASYSFVWTITGEAPCAASSDTVFINISSASIGGNTNADATVCSGSNGGTITLTGNTGNILRWESSANNGTTWSIFSNTTNTTDYTNLTATTWYRAVVQSGVCPSAFSDTTILTVVPQVQAAHAGNDQVICGSTAVLNANAPSAIEVGSWLQVSGPNAAVLSATNLPTLNASGLVAGTYTFVWTLSNPTCPSTTDTMLVHVRPSVTVANAGNDAVICDMGASGVINLAANINSSRSFEIGTWTIISQPASGNASFSNANDPQAAFTVNATGTYQLLWTITNDAGCAPTIDTLVIHAFAKPVAGTVSGISELCAGNDVTISMNSWVGNIKKWQYNPAPLNDNIWLDTLVTTGTIQFLGVLDSFAVRAIVVSSGAAFGCTSEDTSNIHVVNVAPGTVPGTTGPNAIICAGTNGGIINLTGNVGAILRWEYSINNGSSWIAISNTTNQQSYSNLTTTTWYRAVIQSASCGQVNSSTTVITVTPPVTLADAGSNIITCNGSVTLGANDPSSIETGSWTQAGGPTAAVFSSSTSPSANVSNLAAGQYSFVWTLSNGGCPSTSDTVLVIVRPATTIANAGTDTVICDFVANGFITLNGNNNPSRVFETSNWSIIAQPAGANATLSDAADPKAIFNFDRSGTYTLRYSITNDGGCAPVADTINIHVFDKPVAGPLQANTQLCAGADATVTLTSYTGVIQKWQYNPAPIADNIWIDTAVTNSAINFMSVQDTFAVRVIVISNGGGMGCNSSDTSDAIIINVAPQTVAGITAANTIVCAGSNSGTINLSGNVGDVVRWEFSTNSGNNWSAIANNTNQLQFSNLNETTWYRAIVESGNCGELVSTVTIITVTDGITAPNAGADQVLCNVSSTVLSANNVAIGETGTWSQAGGAAVTFSATNIPTVTVSGMAPGTYTFVYTTANNACPDRHDTIVVINYPDIINTIDTAAQTACSGQPVTVSGQQGVGGNGSYTYQWQQSTNGSSWVNISGETNQSIAFIPTGNVYVRRIVFSVPCQSISEVAFITVQPPLADNSISSNQDICINTQPVRINGSLPTGGTGVYNYVWQESTDSGATWLNIPAASGQHYQPGVLNVSTLYRRVVSSGLCVASQSNYSDSVIIRVNPDAQAQFTFAKDTACPVFVLDTSLIKNMHFAGNGGYLWYANNNLLGTTQEFPGYSITKSGDSVMIRLVALSAFGCKNDTIEHMFYAKMKPTPAFTVNDSVGCGPLTVAFTNNTPDANYYQFHWNFGNGQTTNAFNPGSVVFMPNGSREDTVYNVALTVYSECDSVVIYQSIRVKAQPRAAFNPDKTFGCSPLTVDFRNLSAGSQDFTWDFGDGTTLNTPSTNNVQHTFTSYVRDTFEVKLIARNDCGTDTSRFSIIVSPNNIGLYVVVNGTEQAGCAPHAVRFFNNSTGANNFQWDFADGNTLTTSRSNDTVLHVFNEPGVYRVRIYASNGCSDTATYRTITVHGKPLVNFTATPAEVCIGEKVNFNNLSDTITSSSWFFGDGGVSSLTHPQYAYSAAGNYRIKLVGSRTYSSGNTCIDSSFASVRVIDSRPGSFSVSDSISRCVPFTVTFINNILPSALTTWNFGNGRRDTGNVVTHTFTTVGTFVVVMNAVAPGGCKYEATKDIIVTGPAGSMNYESGLICTPRALRFETIASGTDSVRWFFGDGTSRVTAPGIIYHTYTTLGRFVPSVELISGNNGTCRQLLPGTDTITVDKIDAGFTTTMLKDCGKTTVSFTDTSRSFFGVQQWSWNFGDGGTANIRNPQHDYTSTNNWQVRLIATSALGCKDTTDQVLAVAVNNTPQAAIISDSLVCAGNNISFRSSVISADSISMYLWSFSNGTNASGSSATTTFNSAGTQTVRLVVSTNNGCRDTAYRNITVNPSPVVTATGGRLICQGEAVQLNATGALTYTWTNAGTLSCNTCPNPLSLTPSSATYEVTGVNSYGCIGRDTVQVRIAQPFNIEISGNDTVCLGESIQLSASGADYYRWTPAAFLDNAQIQNPVATPVSRTSFRVIGFDSAGCFNDTAYINIAVGKVPTVSLGPDKVVAAGTMYPLVSTVTNGPITKYQWTSGSGVSCDNCVEPMAHIKYDIAYSVKVTNTMGCTASDTIRFKVFCEQSQVYIPNLFTPDGDGVNDVLMVRGKGIKSVKNFRIFNRWGEIVFEKANFEPNIKSHGWDGTIRGQKAPPDVYVYTCEVMCENDVPFTYKGNVAIIK